MATVIERRRDLRRAPVLHAKSLLTSLARSPVDLEIRERPE
jgi:hypothetical protein